MSYPTPASSSEVMAAHVVPEIELNARDPAKEWQSASPVSFCSDCQGKNPDPALDTEVRVLSSSSTLYLRSACRYRVLHVLNDADPNGPRYHSCGRAVASARLRRATSRRGYHK